MNKKYVTKKEDFSLTCRQDVAVDWDEAIVHSDDFKTGITMEMEWRFREILKFWNNLWINANASIPETRLYRPGLAFTKPVQKLNK
jgi:hypothetical protein